jgi:two-component system osmolarity sensor histidine kinase EnvZ
MHFIHKLIPQTLLARFVLIIIVPTLIGQILAVFLFYDRHWYNVSYYTSSIIVNEISALLEQDNLLEQNALPTNYLNLSYQFCKNNKFPLVQPKITEELEIFKNILDAKIRKKNVVKINKEGKIEVLFLIKDSTLKITFPTKLLVNPTVYIFVLWLVFLTIMLLSISLIFSRNQIKSILTLANAADQFGRGIELKYKPSGALEIRKAGFAFLKMKERIEKQIAKRTRMLAMISHDLFTPLTRMKLQIELMEKSEEILELEKDIISMQHMVKSYLDFAQGESGEELQTIDLYSWIPSITKKCSHDIELLIPPSSYIQVKVIAFERAISNVINNAIKYSTKIKISVYSNDSNMIIRIEDNGIGIRDEEKLLVLKPFYRSDKARSLNNSGNVGLGLAITKEIIINHRGTITLQDSKKLGGLLVKISLPKGHI